VNAGQYEGLMARLGEILDRMPVPASPDPVPFTTHHLDGTSTTTTPSATREADKLAGARRALVLMLGALDGWIEGARSNHDGLGHRGEPMGSECWTQFHPSDIRRMVNDVAHELGMSEFADPEEATEDKVR
jgi:hypothetical protein